MRNAIRFNEQITIGLVPDSEDLRQLKELGYKTLVDVREEKEKFGGQVEKRAREIGLNYASIPISREEITIPELNRFYRTVYAEGGAPLYVFSRFGRKPLAFLLVAETVARAEPVQRIFQRASRFGLSLEGDQLLQGFIVNLINLGSTEPIMATLRELQVDLVKGASPAAKPAAEPIALGLEQALAHWTSTHDRAALRKTLGAILDSVARD